MRQHNLYMYTIEMVMNETAELIHVYYWDGNEWDSRTYTCILLRW